MLRLSQACVVMAAAASAMCSLRASAAFEDEVFLKNPQTASFRLKDGSVVRAPIYYDQVDTLAVNGLADLEAANRLLKPQGLFAVPMDGKALVTVMASYEPETTLGPQTEVAIGIIASSKKVSTPEEAMALLSKMSPAGGAPSKDVVIFPVALYGDSKVFAAACREIWGNRKTEATIRMDRASGSPQGFALVVGGKTCIETRWSRPAAPSQSGGDSDVYIRSPKPKATLGRSLTLGASTEEPLDTAGGDHFEFNESCAGGRALKKLGFVPALKNAQLGAKSLFFAPVSIR